MSLKPNKITIFFEDSQIYSQISEPKPGRARANTLHKPYIVFPLSTCRYPPPGVNTLVCMCLLADTTDDCPRPPVSALLFWAFIPHPSSSPPYLLFVSPSLSLRNTIKSIYRCATATLPLRNVHLAVAQQQGGRCAAVNKNAGFTIVRMRTMAV